MPFPADIEAFVQAAVRLPHDRLRKIDRQWDGLSAERGAISELVQASNGVRLQMSQLREYIAITARMAGAAGEAETGPRSLLIEDVTEAIFPAARALLLRELLENSTTPGRAAAFAALTAPFLDIMPGNRSTPPSQPDPGFLPIGGFPIPSPHDSDMLQSPSPYHQLPKATIPRDHHFNIDHRCRRGAASSGRIGRRQASSITRSVRRLRWGE